MTRRRLSSGPAGLRTQDQPGENAFPGPRAQWLPFPACSFRPLTAARQLRVRTGFPDSHVARSMTRLLTRYRLRVGPGHPDPLRWRDAAPARVPGARAGPRRWCPAGAPGGPSGGRSRARARSRRGRAPPRRPPSRRGSSRALVARPSSGHGKRSTSPRSSSRRTTWESRGRVALVRWASAVIRRVRSGASREHREHEVLEVASGPASRAAGRRARPAAARPPPPARSQAASSSSSSHSCPWAHA